MYEFVEVWYFFVVDGESCFGCDVVCCRIGVVCSYDEVVVFFGVEFV